MANYRPRKSIFTSYERVTLRSCLLLLSLTIKDVVNLESPSQSHSAGENGDDQAEVRISTTGRKLTPVNEISRDEAVSRRRLNPKSKITTDRASLIAGAAAKFMMNVYENSEMKPNAGVVPSEFDLTENDLRTIDQSDVVITFMAQQGHQGAVGKREGVQRVWFKVDDASVKDQLISAQLRLYRDQDAKNSKDRGDFIITAYRVLRGKDGETDSELVDSANTTGGHEGWITLNLTESLLHWMKHPEDNDGLYLAVRSADLSSSDTTPEDIGIVGFETDAENRQPFLTGFFRNSESGRSRHIRPKFRIFENYNKRNTKRHTLRWRSDSSCKVKEFYLDLTNLAFDNRIIAPEGYYANYCSGECTILPVSKVATNHSKFLSHANLLQPDKVPKPCCAPMKLSSIDIIWYIDEKTIKKEKLDKMVVDSCGCF